MPSRAPEPADRVIGSNVRLYRLARGMSQSELATRLGITFQQVQKYEKAMNRIGSGRLVRIAEILDVPVTNLIGAAAGAPNGNGHAAIELLADRHRLRLVQGFAAIADAGVRRAIVHLVDSLAKGQSRGE